MHRRSGHHRGHEPKRRAGGPDSGTTTSSDGGDAANRARHGNGGTRAAKRQRQAPQSRRGSGGHRHAPVVSSSSSSSSSSSAALTPYAIEAGAAVAAAYPHAISSGEAAMLVATMAAEGAAAAAAAGDSSDSSDSLQPGTVVADRFALGRVAGSGGFGVVYEAVDMADPQRVRVAIKMEKGEHRVRSLRHEAVVFAALAGGPGVPPVLWSGSATAGDGRRVDVLVMPLLGDSLYDYMRSKASGHLPPAAVMRIARYILRYLEHMHARGWLHRDVKPHNFLLDRSRRGLFMVDYGLAKRWCDPRTGAHVEYERRRNRSSVPGTAKYASLNTHQGVGTSAPLASHVLFFFSLSLSLSLSLVWSFSFSFFFWLYFKRGACSFSVPIGWPPLTFFCWRFSYCHCMCARICVVSFFFVFRQRQCRMARREFRTTLTTTITMQYGKKRQSRLPPVSLRRPTVQSRRDDLEALAYTLVQLAKGSLPWDSVPGHNKAKRCARIRDCKAKTGVDVICAGLPPCFARFLAYARALSFPETPDYEYCRGLFGSSSSAPPTNRRRHNNNAS